jgi:hypothetical protein
LSREESAVPLKGERQIPRRCPGFGMTNIEDFFCVASSLNGTVESRVLIGISAALIAKK